MRKFLLSQFFFFSLLVSSLSASGADIWSFTGGGSESVVIEGRIEEGDFNKFIDAVEKGKGNVVTVYLFTPGGSFYEAMKIGEAIRDLELASVVPTKSDDETPFCGGFFLPKPKNPENCTCASAGFFIHIGSVHRGGTYLAVHRPHFIKGEYGGLPQSEAQDAFERLQSTAKQYMNNMGVPEHLQSEVLGISSERVVVLDDETVKTFFWQGLPYRHEWMRNRCGELSPSQIGRLEIYSDMLASQGRGAFSSDEKSDFFNLMDMEKKEIACVADMQEHSREKAYKDYFQVGR